MTSAVVGGVPVLLNPSFHKKELIVHQAAEVMDGFLRTQMDVLVLGKYVVEKITGENSCDAWIVQGVKDTL